MKKYFSCSLLLMNLIFFLQASSQSCSWYNSAVTWNYCCGHDPEFLSQTNSHKLYQNGQGNKNFCNHGNFTLEHVNSVSTLPNDWTLIWFDDFNYSTLDSSFYSLDLTGGNNYGITHYLGNQGPQTIITPDNVVLANGKMQLTAKYDPNPTVQYEYYPPYVSPRNKQHVDYTVGNVSTNMKFPMNSRYQSVIKAYPNTPVSFPAWWLYGQNGQEIDMFEYHELNDDHLLMTYHNPMDGVSGGTVEEEGVNHSTNTNASSGFKQYDLIWDKYKVEWYFEGSMVHRINKYYHQNHWNNNNIVKKYRQHPMNKYSDIASNLGEQFMRNRHFPDQHAMQLIWDINLQYPVTPSDVGPGKAMEIEYVKVWVRGCGGIRNITQNVYVEPPSPTHGSIIEKGQIVKTQAGSNVNIPQYHYAIYAANDEIELRDGFSVTEGGTLFAFITTCTFSWDNRLLPNDSLHLPLEDDLSADIMDIPSLTSANAGSNQDITVAYDNEQIKFNCTNGNIYSLTIQDMQGQIVFETHQSSQTIAIDKSKFAPAVYTAIINSAAGLDIRKIWIMR